MARPPRRRRPLPSNIRPTPYGIQVYTRVGGRFQSKHYPFERPHLTTPDALLAEYDEEIRAWLAVHREPKLEPSTAGKRTMLGGLPDYLQARAAMPTIAERELHLREWIAILRPDTKRRDITPLQIQQQRDRWLTVGPKRVQRKGTDSSTRWALVDEPLSSSSVNHRLRALQNYFRVLDPQLPNPVRDVDDAHEPEGVPRAVSYPVLLAIFDKLSNRPLRLKGVKESHLAVHDSRARARIEVLIWTGITSKELARLVRHDIHWEEKYLVVRDRRKGAGAPGRLVPLVPEAIAALTRFDALKAYGPFSNSVLLRAWQRACVAADQPKLRIYDIRHSFITGYLRATKDLAQAQLLAGQKHQKTTRRYAAAAILPTLEVGMQAFGQHARNRPASAGLATSSATAGAKTARSVPLWPSSVERSGGEGSRKRAKTHK